MALVFARYGVQVDAVKYDGTNAADVMAYLNGLGLNPFMAGSIIGNDSAAVHVGDWLAVSASGVLSVLDDATFSGFHIAE